MADIAKIKKNNKNPGHEPAMPHLWPQHPAPYTTKKLLHTCLPLTPPIVGGNKIFY